MKAVIITGGSKGIGRALAQEFIKSGYRVYILSRTVPVIDGARHIQIDLSVLDEVSTRFTELLDELSAASLTSLLLINNAGRLGTIKPLDQLAPEDIQKTMTLNTTIPLVLSSLFIKKTEALAIRKDIINISSGAATKPYEGWSVYCTSKAALDMLTKATAAEQEALNHGVTCIALYPGVVDTEMQTQIRSTSEKDFKNVQRFIDLKQQQQLYTPSYVATTIVKLYKENTLANGTVLDIRNLA